ncbi:MAG: hypothetical protein ACTHN0_09095 [Aquihabitans sp.]
MMRTDRLPLAVVLMALVTCAAACGASAGPEAIDDPRPSSTTTSEVTDPPAPNEVVWQQFTGGGFVPSEYVLRTVPLVTIYGDGRILRSADSNDSTLRPIALEQARIPDDELDAFLSDAADSGLFDPGTDFGDPSITDMASTTVTLRTGSGPHSVDVYALSADVDESIGGVTDEQLERRRQLQDLLARARSLGEDPTPYVPERVRATLIANGSQIDAGAAPKDWPGPPISAFPEPAADGPGTSCLVIEGAEAAAVTTAAADNPDALWKVDGEVHQIVTAPLIPGQEGCPPS